MLKINGPWRKNNIIYMNRKWESLGKKAYFFNKLKMNIIYYLILILFSSQNDFENDL